MNEDTPQKVVGIISELLEEVKKTSGEIDESAKDFWVAHYTPLFIKAIDEKGRTYDGDKDMLLRKARALAAAARGRAGRNPISRGHAEDASKDVDCKHDPTLADPVHTDDYWCY